MCLQQPWTGSLLYAAQAAGILATKTEMRSPPVNVGDGLLYLPGLSLATPQYSCRIEWQAIYNTSVWADCTRETLFFSVWRAALNFWLALTILNFLNLLYFPLFLWSCYPLFFLPAIKNQGYLLWLLNSNTDSFLSLQSYWWKTTIWPWIVIE